MPWDAKQRNSLVEATGRIPPIFAVIYREPTYPNPQQVPDMKLPVYVVGFCNSLATRAPTPTAPTTSSVVRVVLK